MARSEKTLKAKLTTCISMLSISQSCQHRLPLTIGYQADPVESQQFDFRPDEANSYFSAQFKALFDAHSHGDGFYVLDLISVGERRGFRIRVRFKEFGVPEGVVEIRRLH